MKRVVQGAVAGALCAGLLMNGSPTTREAGALLADDVTTEEARFSPEQRTLYTDESEKLRAYWGHLATETVLLESDQVFLCPPSQLKPDSDEIEVTATEGMGALYCQGSDKIIINGAFASSNAPDLAHHNKQVQEAGEIFVLAHEFGHAKQFKKWGLDLFLQKQAYADRDHHRVAALQESRELQADCHAGAYMRDKHPAKIDEALLFIRNFDPHSIFHGTVEERMDAFRSGANGESC